VNKYSLNIIWSREDQGYIATCPEFPGLSAFGESFEDAVAEAKLAQELFIETYESEGIPLPEPQSLAEYSGQFRLRIPSTLHAQLARKAEQERISLNQYILTILASQIGGEEISKRFEMWLEKVEKRLVKVTAANNAECVVALMKAWDHSTYAPVLNSNTASGFADILVTRTEKFKNV
jgi:predicted RNase H-like HicB family nuclease